VGFLLTNQLTVMRQIVRNYGARNNLKSMKRGDLAFFYHRFVSSRNPETMKMRNEKEKYHVVPHHLFIYSKDREETVVFRG